MRRCLLVLLVGLVATVTVRATAVVAFRRPDRIVLASDEALTAFTADGAGDLSLACKIRPLPDRPWWILNGGLTGVAAPGEPDVFDLAAQVVRGMRTVPEAVQALAHAPALSLFPC